MRIRSALWLLGLCTLSSGCQLAENAVRNITNETKLASTEMKDHFRYRHIAKEQWTAIESAEPTQSYSKDYVFGFIDGFADFLEFGGDGKPPYLPPHRYWQSRYRTPEGYRSIEDWFAGCRHGIMVAQESGYRQFVTVPSAQSTALPPLPPGLASDPKKPSNDAAQWLPPLPANPQGNGAIPPKKQAASATSQPASVFLGAPVPAEKPVAADAKKPGNFVQVSVEETIPAEPMSATGAELGRKLPLGTSPGSEEPEEPPARQDFVPITPRVTPPPVQPRKPSAGMVPRAWRPTFGTPIEPEEEEAPPFSSEPTPTPVVPAIPLAVDPPLYNAPARPQTVAAPIISAPIKPQTVEMPKNVMPARPQIVAMPKNDAPARPPAVALPSSQTLVFPRASAATNPLHQEVAIPAQ